MNEDLRLVYSIADCYRVWIGERGLGLEPSRYLRHTGEIPLGRRDARDPLSGEGQMLAMGRILDYPYPPGPDTDLALPFEG